MTAAGRWLRRTALVHAVIECTIAEQRVEAAGVIARKLRADDAPITNSS